MKNNPIAKICNVPLDFQIGEKSAYAIAKESGFEEIYKEIKAVELVNYLKSNLQLVEEWIKWSENKRTSNGWFFLERENSAIIGYLDENGQTKFQEKFDNFTEACANYILRELVSILKIEK